jgi:hypothetical protein
VPDIEISTETFPIVTSSPEKPEVPPSTLVIAFLEVALVLVLMV